MSFITDRLHITHHKAYIFPAVIVILLVTLSLLRISGTSMGVYDYLFGESHSNLIAGEPRTVRSDEWIVNTPFTIAQSEDHYAVQDKDIGQGQDMSVVIDVPYKSWSILFHPQNWIFFVVPLEIAFAFKWWLLAAALMMSVYTLILELYPKRYLIASLLAVFFALSPFIQWWYQTITILPIVYSLFIIVAAIRLIEARSNKVALLYSSLLSYLLVCFALIMYPAFQISTAIVAVVIFASILTARKQLHLLWTKRSLLWAISVIVISIGIVGLFLYQHLDAVKATLSTIYPGSRHITSGGFSPIKLLTWPLSYLLQDSQTAGVFNNNQSEISNFMLFGFVILPFLGIIWYRTRDAFTRIEKTLLISLSVTALLIFWRMFIPFGDLLFSVLGLASVPHVRLFIALGVINLILIAICMMRQGKKITSLIQLRDTWHLTIFTSMILIYGLLIIFLIHHFVITTIGIFEGSFIVIVLGLATSLLLSSYTMPRYAGLILITLFTIVSSGLANPLYRGLSLDTNGLVSYIKNHDTNNSDYWISNNQPYLSSAILASGAKIYGGVNTYPQMSLWGKYFPHQTSIFNRYSHIRFEINQSQPHATLSLIQADSFRVITSDCDPLLKDLHIRYIISDIDLGSHLECHPLKDVQTFGEKRLYIYSY